jgi:hypothetical protein
VLAELRHVVLGIRVTNSGSRAWSEGFYSFRAPAFSKEKGFGGKSDWFSYKRGGRNV